MNKATKAFVALGSAALLTVTAFVAIPSAATATDTQEVWWLVPEGVQLEATDHPQGDGFRIGSEGFPQTLLPNGEQDLECGRYAQVDYYPADAAYDLIKDGVLHEGEDHSVILNWRFVYGGDCVDVTPEPEIPVEVPEQETPTTSAKEVVHEVTVPTAPSEIQTAAQ